MNLCVSANEAMLLSNTVAAIRKLGVTDLTKENVVVVLFSLHETDRLARGAMRSDGEMRVAPPAIFPLSCGEKECERPTVPPSV